MPKSVFLYLLCHLEYISMNFFKEAWMKNAKKQNKAKTNLNLIISLTQLYGSRTVALNFGCTFFKITEIFKTTSAHNSILSEVRIYRAGDEEGWEWWQGWHWYFFQVSQVTLGEGDGTPLQHSCLENPMDGGAWWAAVHGVTKSWAQQWLHFHFSLSMHWRRKWHPTPVFLPGESRGWGSLAGCRLWGRTELGTTEAT